MIPETTMAVPTQVQIVVRSCSSKALAVRTARKPRALNGYAMLSGTRLSVVIQATAEMPNTVSPSHTNGEVAAAIGRDGPPLLARSAAPDMPCLSSSWPAAAAATANRSRARLGADNLFLPDDLVRAPTSARSVSLDNG